MGATKFDELNAKTGSAKRVSVLPTAPYDYYGVASNDVDSVEWRGGELALLMSSEYRGRLYAQVSTSGTTAIWIRLLDTMATTTTSSSSSSSSSSSTSSSSSSTSSSSSSSSSTTTTSSSSSSTSTSSTSSSSTTTGA